MEPFNEATAVWEAGGVGPQPGPRRAGEGESRAGSQCCSWHLPSRAVATPDSFSVGFFCRKAKLGEISMLNINLTKAERVEK